MGQSQEKSQTERELGVAFFERMGWRVEWIDKERKDKPDIRLRAAVEGQRMTVGVEVTEYTESEKARRVAGEWEGIQGEIEHLRRGDVELRHAYGCVWFQRREIPPRRVRKQLAAELVLLARNEIRRAERPEELSVDVRTFGPEYASLGKYVRRVRLRRQETVISWDCGEMMPGFFGPGGVWEWVRVTVRKKTEQLREYERTGMDEVWLLLCAAGPAGLGRGIHTMIGEDDGTIDQPPDEILADCRASGFERVFLYEKTSEWVKELWSAGKRLG